MLSSPLGRTQSKDVRRGMTSPPLDSTHSQTTFGVTYHHRLWTVHTVEKRRAWHAIITFGQHTRSNYVGRGMPSSPLGSTNGRTTSGVACHHLLLDAHTIERCRAWPAIIAHGRQTRSNDIRRDMPSSPLASTHGRTTSGVACHHRLRAIQTVKRCRAWHAITALGLHARSDDVTSHHYPWTAHTVERRRVLHATFAIRQHTQSNNVGRCMPSSPLGSTNGRGTSRVACHNRL